MISWHDLYTVLCAVVPLYVAMILAYGSVRWWGVLTPEQCAGINRFVAVFAVPLLSFHFISNSDPYAMNLRFIAADTLQKGLVLAGLAAWSCLPSSTASQLDWPITVFSLSSLPNTLIMGLPLLVAMYGPYSGDLMVQVVVMQSTVWYTLLLTLFELRAARMLIAGAQCPPDADSSIASVHVHPDVVSLEGSQAEAVAEVAPDGRVRLVVTHRQLSSSRPSNLTGVEIYSVSSSRNATPPRGSTSFAHDTPLQSGMSLRMSSFGAADLFSLHSPRPSTSFDDHAPVVRGRSAAAVVPTTSHDPAANNDMFEWSAAAASESSGRARQLVVSSEAAPSGGSLRAMWPGERVARFKAETDDALAQVESGATAMEHQHQKDAKKNVGAGEQQTAPAGVMTRLILTMVWRRLIRNPNTYASLVGLTWSLIAFRFHIAMPTILKNSITILSDAGLGMAMFSLGLFMAMQPKLIACGTSAATSSMAIRFLCGPAVMAAASVAIGLRGTLLRIAILQAALPQGIVSFVFAKEYNLHATILCTGVVFGMLIALPIVLVYYIILGLL